MNHHLWTILFTIVLAFYAYREKQYILIYYTIWTFIVEWMYFVSKSLKLYEVANMIWPYLVAPAIVVCVGFWAIVAPMQFQYQPPSNMFLIFVTHGLNMVAVIAEKKKVFNKDIWKPMMYTAVYNFFLAIYVGGGGRSITGELPYWYTQYDRPIGWIFAALAIAASGVVHFIMAVPEPRKDIKQYIV